MSRFSIRMFGFVWWVFGICLGISGLIYFPPPWARLIVLMGGLCMALGAIFFCDKKEE